LKGRHTLARQVTPSVLKQLIRASKLGCEANLGLAGIFSLEADPVELPIIREQGADILRMR
jgi:hypothetical protein